jgi:tetratricopeptide (TPR) repeat protein
VDLLVSLAALREASEEYKEAGRLLRQSLGIEPNNAETHFRLGVVLDKRGERKASLAAMRKAIELNNRHARALNYVGYTLVEGGGDLVEAERLIRRALAVEPNSGYILDSLGWVYFKKGQYEQAYNYLLRAEATGEDDPVIYEHLGEAALALDRPEAAVSAFEKALKSNHPKPEAVKAKLQEARARLRAR